MYKRQRYIPERQGDRWVVIDANTETVVSIHPRGALGAEEASTWAQRLNSAPERTPDHGLVEWRKAHGLSQAALAARLGVDTFTVQRWEYGERRAPAMLSLALERLEQLL